jgi:glycosyltransferase involved in cell wall biosynthesis
VRVLIWHGWTLEGSGSNVYTARVARILRDRGHDVALVCQEPHPERYGWIDASAVVGGEAPPLADRLRPFVSRDPAAGSCVLLRPAIGELLPVFVLDRYEGFRTVRRFVDLTAAELEAYLRANVEALRAAVSWHDSQVVIAGHAVPGPAIAARAMGPDRYIAKIHGSDLEYALRPQERYRELAREGLSDARAVIGGSRDVLERCRALVPETAQPTLVIPPGVDAGAFRPRPRRDALLQAADRLDADRAGGSVTGGRPASADADLRAALGDIRAIDAIGAGYDQEAPDEGAAAALRALAETERPIVGYLGKLIPQKGVELLLEARAALADPVALIVGFGSHRERLEALAIGDRASGDVVFTGRLDHRYAPAVVAAMDVLVVPSVLEEAFGMVAAEGAAAGALPFVARHSGLAEVAEALEAHVGRPGLFSFEPGPDAAAAVRTGLGTLLSLPAGERADLRRRVSAFAARTWSWERTAEQLLAAAT